MENSSGPKKSRLKKLYQASSLDFYTPDTAPHGGVPFYESPVMAGFPSPAEDYMELKLDLNKFLIRHPSATFYVRVKGSSMQNAGIHDGDILIVDRSLEPKDKDIAVCVVDGEYTVKRLRKTDKGLWLLPENPDYQAIKITEDNEFQIWGVVSYVIHKTQ